MSKSTSNKFAKIFYHFLTLRDKFESSIFKRSNKYKVFLYPGMAVTTKNKKFNEYSILRISVKHYFTNVKNMKFLFLIILLTIIIRRILEYLTQDLILNIDTAENLKVTTFNIFARTIIASILSALGDFIILWSSAFFQTNISVKALVSILKNEAYGEIDLTSGKTQYAISEGSYAMSKLIEHCFIEIFMKFSYLVLDFSLIYKNLSTLHLIVGLIITGFACFIHIKGAILIMNSKTKINEARGQCDKNINEDIMNYEIIKSYQMEEKQIEAYYGKIKPWREASLFRARVSVGLALFHDVIFALSSFIFASLLFFERNINHNNTYRTSYKCMFGLERSIENISSIYTKYKESIVSSKLILHYLNGIEGFDFGTTRKNNFTNEIEIKNIRYNLHSVKIIENLSFNIKKGEKICVFGKNGSGKSTISRILMRLCHISSGTITIDDTNIYQIDINDYRSFFTYVPQDTNLFDDTILNNLIYGNFKSFAEVIQECKKMNIHEDILKLENGYNTVVGDRGTRINGGLRQKIFYVRALLVNSPIYIFDEPTNNLDEESSINIINMVLNEQFKDKTVLVICHDRDLVLKFPKVLYFKDGEIIETKNIK